MKVIFSTEAVRFPLTGVGRYSYELAKGLESAGDITELRFFSGVRFLPSLPVPAARAGTRHRLRRFVQTSSMLTRVYQRGAPLVRALTLATKASDHIYHSPNFFYRRSGARGLQRFTICRHSNGRNVMTPSKSVFCRPNFSRP